MSRNYWRKSGKFTQAPDAATLFGLDVSNTLRKCNHCGIVWAPILVTGKCPSCGKQESMPTTDPRTDD